jgi:hypothetical protein
MISFFAWLAIRKILHRKRYERYVSMTLQKSPQEPTSPQTVQLEMRIPAAPTLAQNRTRLIPIQPNWPQNAASTQPIAQTRQNRTTPGELNVP